MNILQIGFQKSGNLWLWNIIERLGEIAHLERRSFIKNQPIYDLAKHWRLGFRQQAEIDHLEIYPKKCFYAIQPSVFRMPVEDMDEYLRQTWHVWTHVPYIAGNDAVLSKFDKIVYLIRDPRDVLISYGHHRFTPFISRHAPIPENSPEEFIERRGIQIVKWWITHVGGYLMKARELKIHFVIYERLLYAFEDEVSALAKYLDIGLSAEEIRKVGEWVSFSAMKEKNPYHLRRGTARQWMSDMSPGQQRILNHIARPMLTFLNYDGSNGSMKTGGKKLPSVPINLPIGRISRITRNARRRSLREKAKRLYDFIRR